MRDLIPQPTEYGQGSARVWLSGRWHHLGKAGSDEAAAEYDRLIGAWLANGRYLPPESRTARRRRPATMLELGQLFVAHAAGYYVKNDRPTKHVANIRRMVELLGYFGSHDLPPESWTPVHQVEWQRWMCNDPHQRWSRKTINEYSACIMLMFRWARREGLISRDIWAELKVVGQVRRGRRPAPGVAMPRESVKVQAVPEQQLAATLEHASPMLRSMIELQLITAMRPAELCAIRGRHIRKTAHHQVMAYDVPADRNKTAHHGIARTVYLGPRAMAVLTPWLLPDPDAAIFTPRRARALWLERMPRTRRRRDPSTHRRRYNETYTTDAYAAAIERACHRACRAAEIPEADWWTWSPHRLRHSGATALANAEQVHIAQMLLGHQDVATTMGYVHTDESRAIAAALRSL